MKRVMTFSEIVRMLEQNGWKRVGVTGSHYHFKHPVKRGKVTVPFHGKKVEFSGFILKSILKQGGFQ
jgi:predicted RNA binding protein YcfA (HicA-like mRNA interferase family)